MNIDNKYAILEKKGYGASSIVFLVKELATEKAYVAKILKEPSPYFDREIENLNFLKKVNSPFIINLINNGIGNIVLNNNTLENKQYIILENGSKGDLCKYIYSIKQGLSEKYSKVIFSKILRGVLSCHKEGICHRDIKLDNILLDENFNPKICDFGFGTFNTGKLNEFLGSPKYAAPEILGGIPYDGFKSDIFSLGVLLFALVTSHFCFKVAIIRDPLYRYIIVKRYKKYWDLISGHAKGVSEELKNLYNKMISFKPEERPTIEEILNDEWMKEIRDLSDEQFKELEIEIREEFLRRESLINLNLRIKAEDEYNNYLDFNRGIEDENTKYFDLELEPKYAKIGMSMHNCIKIDGNLSPAKFMNSLANIITQKYQDNCTIEESKKTLKFKITFEEDIKDEEEIPQELKEEFAKLGIEENIEMEEFLQKKNCVIQCKLYQALDGGHILKFSKKDGELDDFYKNLEAIISLVKKLF